MKTSQQARDDGSYLSELTASIKAGMDYDATVAWADSCGIKFYGGGIIGCMVRMSQAKYFNNAPCDDWGVHFGWGGTP